MKNALIIPDCHVPFEDKEAYSLMLYVAEDVQPDEIVILGDYADFYDVNSHGKSPEIEWRLTEEIQAVRERLKEIEDLFPNANRTFIQGNHEYRLERFINNKAPELYGTIDTPRLLDLHHWNYVPYGPKQFHRVAGSKLLARHEPLGNGVHVAHNTVVKAGCSVIFGHTHRIQESQVVMANGDTHRGISAGWLGDENSVVFNYVKSHHQWSLGFSVATILDNGNFFNQSVHIIDGMCHYGGHLYE